VVGVVVVVVVVVVGVSVGVVVVSGVGVGVVVGVSVGVVVAGGGVSGVGVCCTGSPCDTESFWLTSSEAMAGTATTAQVDKIAAVSTSKRFTEMLPVS
jgi:hypothetical protein